MHHPPSENPDWSTNVTVIKWRRATANVVATGLLALGVVLISTAWNAPDQDRMYQAGLVCIIVSAVTYAIAQNRDDQVRAALRNEANAAQRAVNAARMEALGVRMGEVLTRMDEVMARVDVVSQRVDLVLQSEDIVIRHLGSTRNAPTPLRRHSH